MAGYVRQSAASIITGETVTAAPLNAEFNQLVAAFHATTGHTHDGSTGGGPKIPASSLSDLASMRVLGNVTGSTGAVTAVIILDEDNMVTNSATALATQQSIKAYVDTELTSVLPGYVTAAEAAQTAAEAAQTAAETAQTNAETAETNAETAQTAAETAQTNAETAKTNAETAVTYAEEWAVKAEDSPVSVAAGGDASTTFSALHWAAKAADSAASITGEFSDSVFRINDDADATKQLAFQISGLTTGTTRTITVPDASGTLVLTSDLATVATSGSYNDLSGTPATPTYGAISPYSAISTSLNPAVVFTRYLVDTTSAVTVTLPASPTAGDWIEIIRDGANDVTVGRNGNNIAGSAADLTIDTDGYGVILLYTSSGWLVSARNWA